MRIIRRASPFVLFVLTSLPAQAQNGQAWDRQRTRVAVEGAAFLTYTGVMAVKYRTSYRELSASFSQLKTIPRKNIAVMDFNHSALDPVWDHFFPKEMAELKKARIAYEFELQAQRNKKIDFSRFLPGGTDPVLATPAQMEEMKRGWRAHVSKSVMPFLPAGSPDLAEHYERQFERYLKALDAYRESRIAFNQPEMIQRRLDALSRVIHPSATGGKVRYEFDGEELTRTLRSKFLKSYARILGLVILSVDFGTQLRIYLDGPAEGVR
jgi:hypothetical protein